MIIKSTSYEASASIKSRLFRPVWLGRISAGIAVILIISIFIIKCFYKIQKKLHAYEIKKKLQNNRVNIKYFSQWKKVSGYWQQQAICKDIKIIGQYRFFLTKLASFKKNIYTLIDQWNEILTDDIKIWVEKHLEEAEHYKTILMSNPNVEISEEVRQSINLIETDFDQKIEDLLFQRQEYGQADPIFKSSNISENRNLLPSYDRLEKLELQKFADDINRYIFKIPQGDEHNFLSILNDTDDMLRQLQKAKKRATAVKIIDMLVQIKQVLKVGKLEYSHSYYHYQKDLLHCITNFCDSWVILKRVLAQRVHLENQFF